MYEGTVQFNPGGLQKEKRMGKILNFCMGSQPSCIKAWPGEESHLLPLRAFVGLGAPAPPSPASPPCPPSSALLPNGVVLAPPPSAVTDEPPLPADGGVAGIAVSSLFPFPLELAASALLPSPANADRRTGAGWRIELKSNWEAERAGDNASVSVVGRFFALAKD